MQSEGLTDLKTRNPFKYSRNSFKMGILEFQFEMAFFTSCVFLTFFFKANIKAFRIGKYANYGPETWGTI